MVGAADGGAVAGGASCELVRLNIDPTTTPVVSTIATTASSHSATKCSRASVLERRGMARCRGGACIVNHRTTDEDVAAVIQEVLAAAQQTA